MTSCGNGITEPLKGESCDDGNIIAGDSCSPQCRGESCGNGIIDVGEVCEEISSEPKGACGDDCLSDLCGNGIVNPGLNEKCDPPGPSPNPDVKDCNNYCVFVECGNGFVDSGEQCDDGNAKPGDGCSEQCLSEYCGNGVIDANLGEQCDHGGSPGDRCSAICFIEICGNGILDSDEECDDNNTVPGDGCSSSCKHETCGNGLLEGREVCDDGNVEPGDGCSSTCASESCGDRVTDSDLGEECDDGNDEPGDGCSEACRLEECGNGIVDVGETCDDHNTTNSDGCSELCRSEFCGNGAVDAQFGETCDDGNTQPGDACSDFCLTESCGNHVIDALENCDDGNTNSGDGCSAVCRLEGCGNGVVDTEAGETCDDTNTQPGDGCNAFCQSEICGNNVIDAGETCDDGNTESNDGCRADCRSPSIDMNSPIGQKWQALGGGPVVGDATSKVLESPFGWAEYQSFTNGVIVDTGAAQAVYLTHALFSHWLALAGQTGHTGENLFVLVGLPVADFGPQATYQSAQFERGMIVTESGQPVRLVYGDIYQHYRGREGILGLPRSEHSVISASRRFQQFQFGEIHWHASFGTFDITGPIYNRWQALGGAAGSLGFPDRTGFTNSGHLFTDFQHGVVLRHATNSSIYDFHSLEFALEHLYGDPAGDCGPLGGHCDPVDMYTRTWLSTSEGLTVENARDPQSGDHGQSNEVDVCWGMFLTQAAHSGFTVSVTVEVWDNDVAGGGDDDRLATLNHTYSIDNLWGRLENPVHMQGLGGAQFVIRAPEPCL